MNAVQTLKHWAWRLFHVDENSKATDIGLLIIRVTVGACIFFHHGQEKFTHYHVLLTHPLDPIGIGVVPSVIFAGFSDGICSLLVLLGLFSRYTAFVNLVCLDAVWWLMDHGLQHLLNLPIAQGARSARSLHPLHSIPNYMNVSMYILAFLVIFIAGPGRYSLDKLLEARRMRKKAPLASAAYMPTRNEHAV
jgi:putative oxidoreductase